MAKRVKVNNIEKLLPCTCGHRYEEHDRAFGGVDIRSALKCGFRGLEPTQACRYCRVGTSEQFRCYGWVEMDNLQYTTWLHDKNGH